MKYISTRGGVSPLEFTDAVMMGLADDGGLIIPQSIPDVTDLLDQWRGLSYNELALEVLRLFATDIPDADLRRLIDEAYGCSFDPAVAPVVRVGEMFVLELWRGPTMSFKDVALQLLGNLFQYALGTRGGRLNILGATSGDTGSAAICGVRGRRGIDIFMMHPRGRVSPIQERQMTTVTDGNVHNIAVEGSFDDCQHIMKTLAGDLDFKRRYSLGAVNSVNWARVAAQTVYYFAGVLEVQRQAAAPTVRVCVPTGNFGDILAGWYARRMGLPIEQLILATNENDILSRFFNSGEYSVGQLHHTLAPAMDIQVASNFERYLYYKLGEDADGLRDAMEQFAATGSLRIDPAGGEVDDAFIAAVATTDDVLAAIGRCWEQHEYLIDPHTACGFAVAEARVPASVAAGDASADQANGPVPTLCIATAHPAKFPDAIRQATSQDLAHHPAIDALADLPTRCETLPNDPTAVANFITQTLG